MTHSPHPTALQAMSTRMRNFRPRRRWWRRRVKRSAVALILRQSHGEIEVLMIQRAEREGDPWSGHMAFPGGRMDPDDRTGLRTAMRETEEEIGIDIERAGNVMGRLSDLVSRPHSGRRPMVVSPYVFSLHIPVSIDSNHEVADTVWVPLTYLADHRNRQTMEVQRGKLNFVLPCYHYKGKQIWGMSLRMLDELLELVGGLVSMVEENPGVVE